MYGLHLGTHALQTIGRREAFGIVMGMSTSMSQAHNTNHHRVGRVSAGLYRDDSVA